MLPDTPTFKEWVVLIQQDSEQARQLVISLQAKIKQQGLLADSALTISTVHYEQAQHLLAVAMNDDRQAQRVARITKLGLATLGPYPEREDWIALIREDPIFAREVCLAWNTRRAMLGLQAPQALLTTIETYYAVSAQQQM